MAATITVACAHCGNQMRASTEHIGKKGRCPRCKQITEITVDDQESLQTFQSTVLGETKARSKSTLGVTDVKGWVAGLIGAGATVVVYLCIFFPIRNTALGKLFLERGPIPYVITLISLWGAATLVLKYRAVKLQLDNADLELELIPLDIGLQVTAENVDSFLGHLTQLPDEQRNSILGRRIQGALEHFKHRNSVPEVQEYLATQAELDASGVDSGYTILRAFIWAVPILGFIGTVMGISSAVGGLQGSLSGSSQPAAAVAGAEENPAAAPAQDDFQTSLKQSMSTVTSGLSTAFDTTLVALVMAILLLFPTETLRKIEYGMLDRIEQFANESLLRRMSDQSVDYGETPEVVRNALEAAFREHQRWLTQWQAQVAHLGEEIGGAFEAAAVNMQELMAQTEQERMQRIVDAARVVEELFEHVKDSTSSWGEHSQEVLTSLESAADASRQLQELLSNNNALIGSIVEKQKEMVPEEVPHQRLDEAIRNLSDGVGQMVSLLRNGHDGDLAPIETASEPRGLLRIFRSRKSNSSQT